VRALLSIIFFACCLQALAQSSPPPIGLWREYLPYNSVIDVAPAGNKIYAATPYSLFVVNNTSNAIERMSRITGLSETGISTINYDALNEKLLIAYNNSNIDILFQNKLINIPDIKRDNIIGNKNIYQIYPLGKNYYLSTGLGIIVIDGERYEVKDSWLIGNGGNQVKVNGFSSDNSFFYAATEEGLKKAAVNTTNLADYNSWQLISGTNGLSDGACENVVTVQNKVLLQKNDSIFVQNGNSWSLFYQNNWPIISIATSANKLTVCQRIPSGEARAVVLNTDATVANTLIQPGVISFPRKCVIQQTDFWIADQFGGLSYFTSSSFEQFKPNSPEATASGEMLVYNTIFYATAGEVNDAWNYQYNGNGIYVLNQGTWTNINRYRFSQIDSLLDYISIAIDPADETIWAGSYGGGLLHVKKDQSFEIFKQNRIGPTVGDPTSYRIAGLAFDRENNLWISNYGAVQPLVVKKKEGDWQRFSLPYFITENALTQLLIDDSNYKWIVAAKGGGLLCFDDNNTIDNTADDRWKKLGAGTGNGNLPDGEVLCIAKDKNGMIWVGTINGIGVLQCPQETFTAQACEAVWPIVKQGNFAGYLFNGEEVRSIAIDGADRKWVATKNGVWLVSATGEEVIYQFTEENSPLLSSDVKKIAIDGKTGEVYFATMKGICSFRSTATEGAQVNKDVIVFPNPVPPGFTGTIGIRGLADNSIVKITELDGRLVYQTRALGGQATWDGRDYKGRKISTGVYLVLINTEPAGLMPKEKAAAKIVFISK
jgi:ligand-binding sensor domain-containing protein